MKKEFGNLRRVSLMQIFSAALSAHGTSRADIAEATGLSVMTVGKAVDAMISLDILRQSSPHGSRPGRPSRALYPSAHKWIGIYVIFDSVFSFYMLDLSLRIIDSFDYIPNNEAFADSEVKSFAASAGVFADKHRTFKECIGCGILLPCDYDEANDRTANADSYLSKIRVLRSFEGYTFGKCPVVGNSRIHNTNRLREILSRESFSLVFYIDEDDIKSAVVPPFPTGDDVHMCSADKCVVSGNRTLGELVRSKKSSAELCFALAELTITAVCLMGVDTVVLCGSMFEDMSFFRDALGGEVHLRCNEIGIMPPEIISGDIKNESALDMAKKVRDKWFFEEMLNSY